MVKGIKIKKFIWVMSIAQIVMAKNNRLTADVEYLNQINPHKAM